MNPSALRHLLILTLCLGTAVLVGTIIATGSFEFLFLLSYALLGIYLVAAPGFIPLLAIGLVCPFNLPIPFIFSVPFLLLILGICCIKLFLWKALSGPTLAVRHCFTWGSLLFFAWLGLHYAVNPVLPNPGGFGENVTGFRAYLYYGISIGVILLLPVFLQKREDCFRFLRWVAGLSLFFMFFLLPFIFTKSTKAAYWLSQFGIFVTFFDNGWLRFVVLPGFGLNLLALALLPHVGPKTWGNRLLFSALGTLALILGGNRSSLGMAFVLVIVIMFLRRRYLILSSLILGMAVLLGGFHFIGERVDVHQNLGFLRLLSLASPRVAAATDAGATLEWRKVRWQRTVEEIRKHPLFGNGYGGLENAWIFADPGQFSDAMVEVSVVSGTVHNGFLAGAFALGFPGVILFLIIFISQVVQSTLQARRLEQADPQISEMHVFVCAQLASYIIWIYFGTDLNNWMVWFYLAVGVWLTRLKQQQPVSGLGRESSPAPFAFSGKFRAGKQAHGWATVS